MRRLIIASFIILTMFSWSATWASENQMQHAIQLYIKGRVDDAIKEIDLFIKANPNNADAFLNKGIMIRQKGLLEKNSKFLSYACDLFMRADRLAVDNKSKIIIKGNLGTTYLEMGQYDNAVAAYNDAYRISSRFFYRARIAYCLARQNRFNDAYSIIESASKDQLTKADSPGNEGLTFYNFGLVYSLGNRPKESTIWLEAALSVNKARFSHYIRQEADLLKIKKSPDFQNLLIRFPLPND